MRQLWAPWRLEYVQYADDGEECVFCRAAALPDESRTATCAGAW